MLTFILQQETVSKVLWDGLAGAVGGGVISSIITVLSERRSKRNEVTLNILEQFIEKYQDLAEAKGLLGNLPSLANAANVNKVRKMGDWFEIVSAVCLEKQANVKLLKRLEIPDQMSSFLSQAKLAGASNPDIASAVKEWTNLQEFLP